MTNFHEKNDHVGGRGVTANQKATIRAFDKFYSMFPAFLDVFPDEDAFLTFAFWWGTFNKMNRNVNTISI